MEGMFKPRSASTRTSASFMSRSIPRQIANTESINGQILEEGITEAGSMSSFIAAGTAYSSHGINMIPFFIYYSMFGFQRIGDLIWAAADMRAKGFSDRRHRRPHDAQRRRLAAPGWPQPLLASTFPTRRPTIPAFAYEMAVIILDGIRTDVRSGRRRSLLPDGRQRELTRCRPCPKGVAEGS